MAKLMIETEGETRTEKWEVGRLRRKSVSPCPKGAPPLQLSFLLGRHWMLLGASLGICSLISRWTWLPVASPKSEWAMVEPKHVKLNKSGAGGRPKKKARAK